MAYSGVIDDIKACIDLGIPKRVPIFAIAPEFNVRMYGMSYSEYIQDPDKIAKCEIEAVKKFDYDWVFLHLHDYIEFEPLGITIKGEKNVPLTAREYLPACWDTLRNLKFPDPQRDGKMPIFLDALQRIKKNLGDSICLTGRVGAPFSSVALLYGIEETLILLLEDPDLIKKTVDFFVELQTQWGKAQVRAGADALWLGDCVARSSFISPEHYSEFAAEGALKVSELLKKEGAFVFYHAGEDSLFTLRLMADLQFSALSIGEGIDIKKVKDMIGNKICLLGNIDGIKVLQRSSPEEVEQETKRIMEIGKKNGGYIFNSGEGIPRQTPEENVRTMIQTARKYGLF